MNSILTALRLKDEIENQEKEGGGGVLVYVSNKIDYKRREDIESEEIESIWIEINLPHTKPILFCSVFRPPNSQTEWIGTFEAVVMKASSLHNPWKHLCDLYNLEQMRQKPSRVTSDSETLIYQ